MRPRFALFLVLAAASALSPLAACSSPSTELSRLPVTNDTDASRPRTDSSDPNPVDDGSSGTDTSIAPGGPGRVYAHTKDTLFLLEPISGVLTPVAPFTFDSAAADVIDIAVDRTGRMFATTFDDFFSVDPITAKCTHISLAGSINYPNSLTFVPAGTLDPGKEALVGYAALFGESDQTTYVQIDTTTGDITTKGNMNAGTTGPQYKASGDMISIIDDSNRAYATVKLITDGGVAGTDLFAEVDPVDGHVKRIIGDTKQTNLFGLGYWAGKGYGFSDNGRIVQIDMSNGSAVVLKTLTDDAGVALPWYGAGVTTQAPTH